MKRSRWRSVAVFVVLFALVGPLLGAQASDEGTTVARYVVHDGQLAGAATRDHSTVWSGVRALVPPTLLGLISELEFFDLGSAAEDELTTDAWASLNEDGESFTLGLNLESAVAAFVTRDPDLLPVFRQTVFHEFGHVLSLQASQRDTDGNASGTLVLDEGTLRPESYLNQFYERFWKKNYPRRGVETVDDATGSAFYRAHPTDFITEYAATGPLEDFAESFAFFATEAPPKGNSLRAQKIRFFATFPELAAMRKDGFS